MGAPARALMRSSSAGALHRENHGLLNPGTADPLGDPWRSPGGTSAGRLKWGKLDRDQFSEVFGAYCGADQDLDSRGFARMCKESLLICEKLTVADVNTIFLTLVSHEQGRMTKQQCEAAMQLIAQKKGVEEPVVRRAVVVALGPSVRFTRHEVPPSEDNKIARIDDAAARERIEQATARAQNALDVALQAGLDSEIDGLKAKAKHALHNALLGDANESQESLTTEQLEDVKQRARSNLHAAIFGIPDEDMESGTDEGLETAKANARHALNMALVNNGSGETCDFTAADLEQAKLGARAALDAVLLLESEELFKGPQQVDSIT